MFAKYEKLKILRTIRAKENQILNFCCKLTDRVNNYSKNKKFATKIGCFDFQSINEAQIYLTKQQKIFIKEHPQETVSEMQEF